MIAQTARTWLRRIRQGLSLNQPFIPGTVAALLSLGIWQVGAWKPLEYLAYNSFFQIRQTLAGSTWDDRIAVIAIDEATLQAYEQFPLRRDRYAQLLQTLEAHQPTTIGFDILFVDPSEEDVPFADAITASGNVVLATAWDSQGQPLEIVPPLAEAAAGIGQISHTPDKDGISRQIMPYRGGWPGLGLTLLELHNAYSQDALVALPEESLGATDKVAVNWPGPTTDLPTYSFVDVVEGNIPPAQFEDKLLLVGITAAAFDPLKTPFEQTPPTAGVYLHAALLDNLLNQAWLRQPAQGWAMLAILLLGPLTSTLLFDRRLRGRAIAVGLLPLLWFGFTFAAFAAYRWWLPVAAPIGTILLAGVGVQAREQYEKQQLMSLFGKHVSPETATVLWKNRDRIFQSGKLEAQELTATVMFTDIRGFTSISEKLEPKELLSWLNLYLQTMTDCIIQHGGVVDKYIGDAIMAIFGIPVARTTPAEIQADAQNAIAAGIEMQQALKRLNQKFHKDGKPTIQCGIGIHTGPIVVGSVGGSQRMNYSAIGDAVNIAARLEAMNKSMTSGNPYNLLITGETYNYIRDRYYARPVGSLQLRGREQETFICAVLGERLSEEDPLVVVPGEAPQPVEKTNPALRS